MDGFHVPTEWLLGGGWLTSLTALYWGLYSGYLGTGREIKEKNDTIAFQRDTIDSQTKQISALIRGTGVAVDAVEGVRQAAEVVTKKDRGAR